MRALAEMKLRTDPSAKRAVQEQYDLEEGEEADAEAEEEEEEEETEKKTEETTGMSRMRSEASRSPPVDALDGGSVGQDGAVGSGGSGLDVTAALQTGEAELGSQGGTVRRTPSDGGRGGGRRGRRGGSTGGSGGGADGHPQQSR